MTILEHMILSSKTDKNWNTVKDTNEAIKDAVKNLTNKDDIKRYEDLIDLQIAMWVDVLKELTEIKFEMRKWPKYPKFCRMKTLNSMSYRNIQKNRLVVKETLMLGTIHIYRKC